MTVRFEHCSGGRKKDKNGWNIKKQCVGPAPSLGESCSHTEVTGAGSEISWV